MLVVLSTLGISKHFEEGAMLESVLKLAAFLIFWFALGIYLSQQHSGNFNVFSATRFC